MATIIHRWMPLLCVSACCAAQRDTNYFALLACGRYTARSAAVNASALLSSLNHDPTNGEAPVKAARIELLRRMAAFGGMREDAVERILQESQDVHRGVGETFFREGDTAESLFVLESGSVCVLRDSLGESVLLSTLQAGDCFGEMSLIDFQKRSATVLAETPCRAIEVSRSAIAGLCKHDLEQYTMIMMNLGREVSRRLRKADQRLFELRRLIQPKHTGIDLSSLRDYPHITS